MYHKSVHDLKIQKKKKINKQLESINEDDRV